MTVLNDGSSATLRARSFNSAGTSGSAIATANSTSGQWQHGVAVCTSTTSRTIYLNGANAATSTTSIDVLPGSFSDIIIGRSGFGLYLIGRVAEFGLWNVALTVDEAEALASGYSPLMIRQNNLVGYWPMFGRSGTAADALEEDWVGGRTLSSVGWNMNVADHPPRIIYPGRGQRVFAPGPAAAGFSPAWVPRASQFIGAR